MAHPAFTPLGGASNHAAWRLFYCSHSVWLSPPPRYMMRDGRT
ncbi:hypothetical protein HMPREF9080_00367 [Cardiobacterium valvarum F0432]|uniref:Uncharacterized protein n=1 Tax=Cardiobacterium valvarum F0432 TaxID=797473 RepID=G9ZC85_9GAMM|nr:hypothetical protein HMPREF9080_00367 [Cardiobacterium valvarum F0432]